MFEELLHNLGQCGSAVLRSMAVLGSTTSSSAEMGAAVLGALETLRGMGRESLAVASADEVSSVDAVLRHMEAGDSSSEILVSANMAVYTLCCRNGLAVCGSVEVADRVFAFGVGASESYKGDGGKTSFDVLSAAMAASYLILQEAVSKTPSALRVDLEARTVKFLPQHFGGIARWTDEMSLAMMSSAHEHGVLDQPDVSLACGASGLLFAVGYTHQSVVAAAAEMGLFTAAWRLHGRVCPLMPSAEWWSSKAAVVDVVSVQMAQIWNWFHHVCSLPAGQARTLEVWVPVLSTAIEIVKMIQTARLSSGDTMSLHLFMFNCQVLECAAKDETQHPALLSAGVVDALEYVCANDFTVMSFTIASYAAGAVTALVGRNEEGKTLSRETVFAVLSRAAAWFDEKHYSFSSPPAKALSSLSPRVLTMAISDTNKRIMLEFDGLMDML
eukprot:SAG11_NODE_5286_length_1606_cov_1.529529_1_plen_442_part_01